MTNVPSALSGDIDMCTADAFHDCIYEIIDACDAPIVRVDLRAVSFMDSAGYHALVEANEYAIRRGRIMLICNVTALCATVIGVCDRDNELHVHGLASTSN